MKKIKFFLAAFAAMTGLGMQAQIWTPQAPTNGDFYLYNVGTKTFLSCGESWGTRAVVGNGALNFTLENNGTGYTLFTTSVFSYGNPNAAQLQSNGFVDQNVNATTWTFDPVDGEENTFTLKNAAGTYISAPSDGTITALLNETKPENNYGYWKLINKDNLFPETASEKNPVDITCLIGDANFESENATMKGFWTIEASDQNLCGGVSPNKCAESYRSTFSLSQTITVPNGYYRLSAQGFYRQDGNDNDHLPYFYLNEGTVNFPERTGSENSMNAASASFKNGSYRVSTDIVTVTSKSITLGAKLVTNTMLWCIWDNFQLEYLGPIDLSEYEASLATAVAAAEAYKDQLPAAVYENIASAITANNKTYDNEDDYTTAIQAINNAVSTYATDAIIADYARYKSIKAAALAISDDVDTTDADTEVKAATTTDAIDKAIVTLRAAFLAELPNVTIPDDPGYIDVTAVMVDNASVRQNTNYWTIANLSNPGWNSSAGVCNYNECEFYSRNFKFYQTLSLTPGTWEFGVTGFHRNGNHSTYFYAGEDKILIPGVANSDVDSMADAEKYFDAGNGKVSLKFLIETAGSVEIGIDNKDTETDKWTIFRDFTLKYYGAPDYSVYKDQWAAAVDAANAAKDDAANANVKGQECQELKDLNAAINNAPDESSKKADYLAKINALTDATSAFIAAAPAYDRFVKEQDIAHALSKDITETYPTSAKNALTKFQALKVAEYNYVATYYPYSATSKIGDFTTWDRTGTVNGAEKNEFEALTSQHWSGTEMTYYEQPATGYSNNAWTANYTKTTTLPAGSYVIKVAARAATGANTVAKITCTAATLEGPIFNFGDKGKGITTAGVASFDEGEFCNGGIGRGWVWNYLPFTLDKETEVTMTVVAEATSAGQWFSVCDGQLLSKDDIATAVAYDEKDNNNIENVDVANVTISRNIKKGFNTVCLPFDLTALEVAAAFGTGTEVYAFSEESADANDATINFNKVTAGTISANTPVLVKATTASSEQVFNGVQIVAPTDGEAKAGKNFDFVGTYAPTTVAEGDYFIGDGKLYKSAGSTSMNAFRAYIHAKTDASVRLFIDDVETGIEAINGVEAEDAAIYNIAGQRLGKMQKGINIVNGKKIIK